MEGSESKHAFFFETSFENFFTLLDRLTVSTVSQHSPWDLQADCDVTLRSHGGDYEDGRLLACSAM
jgi:hypothetical protein